jgi:lactate dehydrogenase-like 2-hydroxyacid dehydrogenase
MIRKSIDLLSPATAPTKRLYWKFLEGPITKECRVVFAGKHFHAGLPSIQEEIDRRGRQLEPKRGEGGKTFPTIDYSKIILIHAPTTPDLFKEITTAHIAIPFMERFTKDLFDPSISPNLRLAIQYGVGLEGIDIPAATTAGVAISNVPADGTGNAQATSEHAIYLAISLLRQTQTEYPKRFQQQMLGGTPIPRTLYQKNVTIVGYGAVGSCLARYLVTMGANVSVVRRRPWTTSNTATNNDDKVRKYNSLLDALPETDVLFLACPLTTETYHCINKETIALLPHGALVVNIARGGLVQYQAMMDAVLSGDVGGFASDVGIGHPRKPSEPWDPHDPISKLENTIFTPHVGGYSDSSYRAMSQKIVDAIENSIHGKPPPVWVNQPLS